MFSNSNGVASIQADESLVEIHSDLVKEIHKLDSFVKGPKHYYPFSAIGSTDVNIIKHEGQLYFELSPEFGIRRRFLIPNYENFKKNLLKYS